MGHGEKVKFRSALPLTRFREHPLESRRDPRAGGARRLRRLGVKVRTVAGAGAAAPGTGSQPRVSCTAAPSKQTELMASRGREMDGKQMRFEE